MIYLNLQLLVKKPEDILDTVKLLLIKLREAGQTPAVIKLENPEGEECSAYFEADAGDVTINPVPAASTPKKEPELLFGLRGDKENLLN